MRDQAAVDVAWEAWDHDVRMEPGGQEAEPES